MNALASLIAWEINVLMVLSWRTSMGVVVGMTGVCALLKPVCGPCLVFLMLLHSCSGWAGEAAAFDFPRLAGLE